MAAGSAVRLFSYNLLPGRMAGQSELLVGGQGEVGFTRNHTIFLPT